MKEPDWSIEIKTVKTKATGTEIPVVKLQVDSWLDKKAAKELGELLIDVAEKL